MIKLYYLTYQTDGRMERKLIVIVLFYKWYFVY